jgi:16S rRNA (guanine966-N2)-methyltransferase
VQATGRGPEPAARVPDEAIILPFLAASPRRDPKFAGASLLPSPTGNRVRIIGGAWRRRIVRFPAVEGLRPTPDRVRETLFNWLGQELTGRTCLELYAGTGVLSLEALSRGAALAVAVDRSRALCESLRSTAQTLGAHNLEEHCADARAYLGGERRDFDVIFLDPPFRDDPWPWLLPAAAARLAPGGRLYAEAGHALDPPPLLRSWRSDKAGQVHYHVFARAEPAAEPGSGT